MRRFMSMRVRMTPTEPCCKALCPTPWQEKMRRLLGHPARLACATHLSVAIPIAAHVHMQRRRMPWIWTNMKLIGAVGRKEPRQGTLELPRVLRSQNDKRADNRDRQVADSMVSPRPQHSIGVPGEEEQTSMAAELSRRSVQPETVALPAACH